MTSRSEFITLRGGLLVELTALELTWSLESRGHEISAKDGDLRISNGSSLTAEDRAVIRAHRWQLLAIAGYVAPEVSP